MKGRTKTGVGIDVCVDRINVAAVSRTADGTRRVRAGSISLPDGVVRDGTVVKPGVLARSLRVVCRRLGVARSNAAVGLSVRPLVLQTLDMPKQMPANVSAFVDGEMRQYVTLSGKEILSDFCALPGGADGRRQLLAVATERTSVRGLVKACDASGLMVERVEPAVLACARAASATATAGASVRHRLLVELNGEYLAACLLRKGVLATVRVKNIPPDKRDAAGLQEWLAEEFTAMMRFYSITPGHDPTACDVYVVVRDRPPLPQSVVESLKSVIGTANVTVTDSASALPAADPDRDSAKDAAPSAAALGLALKQLDDEVDGNRINLLPDEVRQTRSLFAEALGVANIAALILLAMVLSLHVVTRRANAVRQKIDRTMRGQDFLATPALVGETRSLDDRIRRAERTIETMQKALAEDNGIDWPGVMRAVAGSTPAEVCVTRLWSADAQGLSVTGLALSYGAAQKFAHNLDGREVFESVCVTNLERDREREALIRYEIACRLRDQR